MSIETIVNMLADAMAAESCRRCNGGGVDPERGGECYRCGGEGLTKLTGRAYVQWLNRARIAVDKMCLACPSRILAAAATIRARGDHFLPRKG